MFPALAKHLRGGNQNQNDIIASSPLHNAQASTRTLDLSSLQIVDDEQCNQSDPSSLQTQPIHYEFEISQHPKSNATHPPHTTMADSMHYQGHLPEQDFWPSVNTSQQMNNAPSSLHLAHNKVLSNTADPSPTTASSDKDNHSQRSKPDAHVEQQYHAFPPLLPAGEHHLPPTISVLSADSAPKNELVRDSRLETPNQWPYTIFGPGVKLAHQQGSQEFSGSSPILSLPRENTHIFKKQMSEVKEHSGQASPLQDDSSSDTSLSSYIMRNFNNAAFADCRLLLTHTNGRFLPTRFSAHSLLIARSPLIHSLLVNGQYSYDFDGLKLIHLHLNDRFVTPSALEAALRTCYGEHVSSFTGSTTKARPPRSKAEFSVTWMSESLAFAASGQLLEIKGAVLRGLEIAGKIINWDNLEYALSFSLEVGECFRKSPPASVLSQGVSSPVDDSDSSTTNAILTPNTSQDSPRTSFGSSVDNPKDIRIGPFSLDYADSLLLRCLQFIATHFPYSWDFDHAARPLPYVDRLPTTSESKSSLAKSRLSRIQFGDLPPEMASQPSSHDSFISSILLSLPFKSLKILVDLENRAIKPCLQSIVEERERRRGIFLQSLDAGAPEREAARHNEWNELRHKEYVEYIQGEPRLARSHFAVQKEFTEAGREKQ